MRKSIAILLALATTSLSAAAFAQGAGDTNGRCQGRPTGPTAARDQEVCFNDTDVRGTREGAGGAATNVRITHHGPGLIRHRAHFVPEMLVSVENF